MNHPNICTLYDAGPNCLVLEFVEGETLSHSIKKGPLPLEEIRSNNVISKRSSGRRSTQRMSEYVTGKAHGGRIDTLGNGERERSYAACRLTTLRIMENLLQHACVGVHS